MTVQPVSVLWRRLDRPGHESSRLSLGGDRWHLDGTAVLSYEQKPCRLDYRIVCDASWHTRSCQVDGWIGDRSIAVALEVDSAHRWRLQGADRPEVTGCLDIDLNFSPSTNLLPIRRLALEVGQEAEVRAAWLRFPSFTLEPLEQIYRRTGESAYRYESAGRTFVADLEVDAEGFVTHYPEFARIEDGE